MSRRSIIATTLTFGMFAVLGVLYWTSSEGPVFQTPSTAEIIYSVLGTLLMMAFFWLGAYWLAAPRRRDGRDRAHRRRRA